jgi:Ca2+/H+ antiporter, TMEM165/GDT1 family
MDATVPAAGESNLQALAQAFAMIIVSEIGDKTFLIAAILAMRHPRAIVFAGAWGSLVVMSMLSASLGHILPTLIPKQWTQVLAAVLFLVFGVKMLQEAREMKAGSDKIREEMKEAEEEIEESEAANGQALPLEELEEGGRSRHTRRPSQSNGRSVGIVDKCRSYLNVILGPTFTQAFVLTFLGEWGDRSQISTIALGAAHVSCLCQLVCENGTLTEAYVECLPSYFGNDCRAQCLYSTCGYWGPLRLHEDFRQTWSVLSQVFYTTLTWVPQLH